MKVFISWSGETSRQIAASLRDWIPDVLQLVKPWMSALDIQSGAYWAPEIITKLEESDAGILCLTKENLYAPWILFEAGALSRTLGKNKVIPYLFGIRQEDLLGPLGLLQATAATKLGTKKLINTLNKANVAGILEDGRLERIFNTHWERLDYEFSDIILDNVGDQRVITERELIEGITELLRKFASRRNTYDEKA